VASLTACDPVKKVGDLWPHQRFNKNGKPLDAALPAIPCGLVAKSMFNDTYTMRKCSENDANCKGSVQKPSTGSQIPLNETGIAWESDLENKFKNIY